MNPQRFDPRDETCSRRHPHRTGKRLAARRDRRNAKREVSLEQIEIETTPVFQWRTHFATAMFNELNPA